LTTPATRVGDEVDGRVANASLIIGRSPAIREVCTLAERVAAGDAKVLITGESGVGKDLIARFIHAHSPRAARPFVPVNCAALAETLLESELFGHVKGSFTGAFRDKVGKLDQAHEGTVFLDEIGEMSLHMQALLLRFLENGEVQRVGSDRPGVKVDVRVLSATNKDLADLVAASQFREDLMFRIDVVRINVPPLRDRREDIQALTEHVLAKAGRGVTFTDDALKALERYRWPGNVRELQNLVERLIWTVPRDVIDEPDLPAQVRAVRAALLPARERRRQLADELYTGLASGALSFWTHVHVLFMNRDITRNDLRGLVRRGLSETRGNFRAVTKLFGMPAGDYKRFLNFLATHDCMVDFRPFRAGRQEEPSRGTTPLPGRHPDDLDRGAQAEGGRDMPGKDVHAESPRVRGSKRA
jgi:transcriptional regulator with GAF, ATPase, and Fis domain